MQNFDYQTHTRLVFGKGVIEKLPGVMAQFGKKIGLYQKELLIIPGAVHTDLYDDKAGVIPYDKMETFFKENLK